MVADPLVWVAAVIGLGVLIACPVIASGRREARKWDAAINAMLRHPKPSYEAFMLNQINDKLDRMVSHGR